MKISNYDEFKYDYRTYWNNRDYEDKAEKLFLNREIKGKTGNWFIDIGGSFGRNMQVYYTKYQNPVIIDYSLETLQKNYTEIKKEYPKAHLIAANAYKLPFKEKVFDGGLMVRVLHHIESPQDYLKEINRVTNGEGIYLQEFANKYHIKAIIRNLFKLNRAFFNAEPYQQPSQGNFEGTDGQPTVFLNFHPKMIQEVLKSNKFKIVRTQGVSFLRIPLIKKLIPTGTLITIEKAMQRLFRGLYFAPSIIISSVKQGSKEKIAASLNDVLACPLCNGNLNITADTAKCIECKKTFNKLKNIWDFRA